MRFTKEEQLKLVKEAKRGSVEARNKIMVRMRPFIDNLVFKYSIKDDYLRDELISECLMEIPKLIERFDTFFDSQFVYYAMVSFNGICKRYFRKEYNDPTTTQNPCNVYLDEFVDIGEREPVLQHEVIADKPVDFDSELDIDMVLKDLSEEDKEILKLYYIEECTQAEIGEVLNIPRETIRDKLAKLLKSLRKQNNIK